MEYLIAGAIVGVFIVIVFIGIKLTNKKMDQALNEVGEDVKDYLINTPYKNVENIANAVYAPAYVHTVTPKGNGGAALYLLFYNRYFPNSLEQFNPADINISKAEYSEHPVKAGDRVYILLNQDKGAKVAWDVK